MVLKKGAKRLGKGSRTVCGKFLLTRRERRVIELIRRHSAALSLPPLEAFRVLRLIFLPSPSLILLLTYTFAIIIIS